MSDIGICKYCKHINKDIIEKPCLHCAANLGAFEFDLSEHDKKVRAEVIEEFARAYEKVEVYGCIDCKHLEDDVHCWNCIAEQLKGKKNE